MVSRNQIYTTKYTDQLHRRTDTQIPVKRDQIVFDSPNILPQISNHKLDFFSKKQFLLIPSSNVFFKEVNKPILSQSCLPEPADKTTLNKTSLSFFHWQHRMQFKGPLKPSLTWDQLLSANSSVSGLINNLRPVKSSSEETKSKCLALKETHCLWPLARSLQCLVKSPTDDIIFLSY